MRSLRIQLWSYNYAPEPTGIAPLSATWAVEMQRRGHDVMVLAAHPHYPQPLWGRRLRPYREVRDGITVLRLPLWAGRHTTRERLLQEVSYTAAHSLATWSVARPDVVVAVSPCFPALLPTMIATGLRHVPWVLWLQDILPDGAAATQIMHEGRLLQLARRLERAAYASAHRIVVISDTFRDNLLAKRVPAARIRRIYNAATRTADRRGRPARRLDPPRVLCMGNVGHSQGLEAVVRAFQRSAELAALDARFVIAGDGVAGDAVRRVISSDRVEMLGLQDSDGLERQLQAATLGAVTQRYDGAEFNMPSKLMNYLAYGLPVVAAVRPDSEVARLIERAGAGWSSDSADTDLYPRLMADVLGQPAELERRSASGYEFARLHLTAARHAECFEQTLFEVMDEHRRRRDRGAGS